MRKLTPALCAYAHSIATYHRPWEQRMGVSFVYRGERFQVFLDDSGDEAVYKIYIDDDPSSIFMRYFGEFKRDSLCEVVH